MSSPALAYGARIPCAISGTDVAHGSTSCYAMSGTDLAYGTRASPSAMSGTDLAYGAAGKDRESLFAQVRSLCSYAYDATSA
eukprot:1504520-Rhodomonas_salina.1